MNSNKLTRYQENFLKVLPANYTTILAEFTLSDVHFTMFAHKGEKEQTMIQGTWQGQGKFKGIERNVSVSLASFEKALDDKVSL